MFMECPLSASATLAWSASVLVVDHARKIIELKVDGITPTPCVNIELIAKTWL
jgi:hypothetical protein